VVNSRRESGRHCEKLIARAGSPISLGPSISPRRLPRRAANCSWSWLRSLGSKTEYTLTAILPLSTEGSGDIAFTWEHHRSTWSQVVTLFASFRPIRRQGGSFYRSRRGTT